MSQETNDDTVSPPVPFPRSYWVVPGKLLAGYYPGDLDPLKMEVKLKGLLQVGIRYVISLMEENERNRYGNPMLPLRTSSALLIAAREAL